jgi:hypothetical protein
MGFSVGSLPENALSAASLAAVLSAEALSPEISPAAALSRAAFAWVFSIALRWELPFSAPDLEEVP